MANKYQKSITTSDASYLLTECKTGVLLKKIVENGDDSDLYCEHITLEDIADFKDIEALAWYVPTPEELASFEPWERIRKQSPTIIVPAAMKDIKTAHLKLIKSELYAADYRAWQINQFNNDNRALKAQKYDKDMIHSGTSDSTALRAEKIMDNPYQNERKRVSDAIQKAHTAFLEKDEYIAEFMREAYSCGEDGRKQYTEDQLMERFEISAGTVVNWKNSIVRQVAFLLGWELPAKEGE